MLLGDVRYPHGGKLRAHWNLTTADKISQNYSPPMTDSFVAIDVETANPDLASICQVGVVTFEQGEIVEQWKSLVNPEDYFDGMNVYIHGIDEDMVVDAPGFPDVFATLSSHLSGQVVVSHTAFDRTSLSRVTEKYNLPGIHCTWLDSARVVRRAWPEFAWSGYGLKNVTKTLGIDFKHHDALEDARAAGEVFVRAMRETGLNIVDWLTRVNRPIDLSTGGATAESIKRTGNPDGPLAGEVMVFTGALSLPRKSAADMAAQAGCDVVPTVKKTTTLLVVGDQDIRKLAGHEKSIKHRKAEELISNGQPIRILTESDFIRLVELDRATQQERAT